MTDFFRMIKLIFWLRNSKTFDSIYWSHCKIKIVCWQLYVPLAVQYCAQKWGHANEGSSMAVNDAFLYGGYGIWSVCAQQGIPTPPFFISIENIHKLVFSWMLEFYLKFGKAWWIRKLIKVHNCKEFYF